MCRSAHRHTNTSHPETENLRANDPWQTGVRKAEAHSEDVDESDGGVASSRQFTTFTFTRTRDLDVCSDKPHRYQHDRSTSHEHLPPAEAIDDVVHGDDDAKQADNAVDASGIQAGRGSGEADRFENPRRVITVELMLVRGRLRMTYESKLTL